MYLKVLAHPSAKRESVAAKGESLVISVKEPASGNHANRRVRELVALRLKVPIAKVRIISGHHTRAKMLSIHE